MTKDLSKYKLIITKQGITLEEYYLGFLSRTVTGEQEDIEKIVLDLLKESLKDEPELKKKIVEALKEEEPDKFKELYDFILSKAYNPNNEKMFKEGEDLNNCFVRLSDIKEKIEELESMKITILNNKEVDDENKP